MSTKIDFLPCKEQVYHRMKTPGCGGKKEERQLCKIKTYGLRKMPGSGDGSVSLVVMDRLACNQME